MTKEIEKKESAVDPWTEIDRAFDAMRRRFAESFGIFPFEAFETEVGLRSPRTDVTDTGTAYRVVAEIPGIPKEKLDIRIRGPTVEIRGETRTETEDQSERFLHRERSYAGYFRAFELPEPVVAADAKAKITDGVLELELPKQHPSPDEVKVRVG